MREDAAAGDDKLVLVIPPCGFCWDQDGAVEALTTWGWWASLCTNCADQHGGDRSLWRTLRAGPAQMPLTEAEAGSYVSAQEYTFAKTMPKWPHEYLLLRKSPDPLAHLRTVAFIRATGHRRRWGREFHTYWEWSGWSYWALPDRNTILNRRHLDWPNDGSGTGDPRKPPRRTRPARRDQQEELPQ